MGSALREHRIGMLVSLSLTALSGYQLQTATPWQDEISTLAAVNRSWTELWELCQNIDFVHFAYYILVKALSIGTSTILELRLISLIAFSISLFFTYLIGSKLGGLRVGILSTLVLGVLPSSIFYAGDARSYSIVMAIVAIASYLFISQSENNSFRWPLFFLLFLFATYLQLFVVQLLPIFLAIAYALGIRLKILFQFTVLYAVGIIPLVATALSQQFQIQWIQPTTFIDPISFFLKFEYLNWYYFENSLSLILFIVLLITSLIGIAKILFSSNAKDKKSKKVLLILFAIVIVPGYFLYSVSIITPLFHQRYVIYSNIALALLHGNALASFIRSKLVMALAMILFSLAGVVHVSELRQVDSKSILHEVEATLSIANYRTEKLWIFENDDSVISAYQILTLYPQIMEKYEFLEPPMSSEMLNQHFPEGKKASAIGKDSFGKRGFIALGYYCPSSNVEKQEFDFDKLNLTKIPIYTSLDTCWRITHWVPNN